MIMVTGMTTKAVDTVSAYPGVENTDPEVYRILAAESQRQANCLELIASENHVSQAVREAVGSLMTNKYAEGYPGRRYYAGCAHMDEAEDLARERVKKLFGCEHANPIRAARPTWRCTWPCSSRATRF